MEKLYKLVNGKKVELSQEEYAQREADRQAHLAKLEEAKANEYRELRTKEYGEFGEQLDMIYHQGLDAWKAHIGSVKAKYPKPTKG